MAHSVCQNQERRTATGGLISDLSYHGIVTTVGFKPDGPLCSGCSGFNLRAATTMATRVGTFVGRYEIVAELGRGAMGVVYRARDPKIDRTVAIKTVSLLGLEPDAEQEYRERFVVEARAAGRLSHPRIVTIFDVA